MTFTSTVRVSVPVAALQDYATRVLAPAVLAAVGLTDDACDLDQLPELTPEIFGWPGLLDRAIRVLTAAAATLNYQLRQEEFPHDAPSVFEVVRLGVDARPAELLEDTRIAVLPHLIGQHTYHAIAAAVTLLYRRLGPVAPALHRLRDAAGISLLELIHHLPAPGGESIAGGSEGYRWQAATLLPLPVWTPQPCSASDAHRMANRGVGSIRQFERRGSQM